MMLNLSPRYRQRRGWNRQNYNQNDYLTRNRPYIRDRNTTYRGRGNYNRSYRQDNFRGRPRNNYRNDYRQNNYRGPRYRNRSGSRDRNFYGDNLREDYV